MLYTFNQALLELLYEDSNILDERKYLKSTIEYINKNCTEYVSAIKSANRFLYRGIKLKENNNKLIFFGESRKKRNPTDSEQNYHDAWNKTLKSLGIDATRDNSIFVTGNMNQAGGYGAVYAIFPINGSKFSWSKTTNDLVIRKETIEKFMVVNKNSKFNKSCMLELSKVRIKLMQLVNDNSSELVKKHTVIVIDLLDKFLISNYMHDFNMLKYSVESACWYREFQDISTYWNLNQLLKDIGQRLKKYFDIDQFQKHFQIVDNDLVSAIKSRHEICVSGKYVAIHYAKYKKTLHSSFGIKQ